jgi:hypothetical protein
MASLLKEVWVRSADIDAHGVRGLPVHDEHDIHFTAAEQTSRHAQVDLIESDVAALRPSVEHFHTASPAPCRAGCGGGCQCRRGEEDLIARWAEVNRQGATLHTIDASKTVDRIIGVFPKNEEHVIRTRLAQTFRYILSQRLVPRADGGGRVAAIEILKATSRTKEYIEKGERDGKSLIDAMRDGEMEGMQCFDQILEKYVREGLITLESAQVYATNRNNLMLNLRDLTEQSARPEPKPPSAPPPAAKAPVVNGRPNGAGAGQPAAAKSMLDMIEKY